jgi:hypothetical protein
MTTIRKSTLLIILEDLTPSWLSYTVLGQPGVKSHIISRESTFAYNRLVPGRTYAIQCSNVDGVWRWDVCFPIHLHEAIN